jgi:hypothetical protein
MNNMSPQKQPWLRNRRNVRCARARQALRRTGGNVTSTFLGVTHHRRTGRYEAHIWVRGKQVCGCRRSRENRLPCMLALSTDSTGLSW